MKMGIFKKLTNYCSAKCTHCPFAGNSNKNFAKMELLLKEFNSYTDALIVLSGGEPFEHPEIVDIIQKTAEDDLHIYRIATGGHIPLNGYAAAILSSASMTGISMGTDILFTTRNKGGYQEIFWSNIQLMNQTGINYSLTFTLGSDLTIQDVKKVLEAEILHPRFFLLQYRDDEQTNPTLVQEVSQLIQKTFEGVVIHYANLD